MEDEVERCPLCRNHCPVNALSCDRGRKYHAELLKKREAAKVNIDATTEPTVKSVEENFSEKKTVNTTAEVNSGF